MTGVFYGLLTGTKHCIWTVVVRAKLRIWSCLMFYMCVVGEIFPVTSEIWWGVQKSWSSIAAEIWEHSSARMLLPWNCWVCVETCTDILWCCVNLSGGGMLWHLGALLSWCVLSPYCWDVMKEFCKSCCLQLCDQLGSLGCLVSMKSVCSVLVCKSVCLCSK